MKQDSKPQLEDFKSSSDYMAALCEWENKTGKPVMSNTVDKHTPGPWRVTTGKHSETTEMWDKGETWFNVNGEDGVIADVLYGRCLPCDEEQAEANAALIAAAPQLKKENERLTAEVNRLYHLASTEVRNASKLEERNRVLVEALKVAAIHVSSISFKADWEIVSEALQSNQ